MTIIKERKKRKKKEPIDIIIAYSNVIQALLQEDIPEAMLIGLLVIRRDRIIAERELLKEAQKEN